MGTRPRSTPVGDWKTLAIEFRRTSARIGLNPKIRDEAVRRARAVPLRLDHRRAGIQDDAPRTPSCDCAAHAATAIGRRSHIAGIVFDASISAEREPQPAADDRAAPP